MKSLVIDTQLLVLLVVGMASPGYIAKHKRLGAYTEKDFDLLIEVAGQFGQIVVTPNTMTEASNLLAQTGEALAGKHKKLFEAFRELVGNSHEDYIASSAAVGHNVFLRLGLTDAALLVREDAEQVLITADFGLYLAAANLHREVVNFNHLRESRGLV